MPFNSADRVKETTTTTGLGNIALGGAVVGFRSFSSVFAAGDTLRYAIVLNTEWEIGTGTMVDATTLARTSVQASSNGGAPVSFGAGSKEVFVTAPAVDVTPDFMGGRTIAAADATKSIVASDKGKTVALTGTFTLTAAPAATLGAGFYCYLSKRDGSGKVTFDPNGTETIDGRTSIGIFQENFLVWTDGANWFSQGRKEGLISIIDTVVATGQTLASLAITGFLDAEFVGYELEVENLFFSASNIMSVSFSTSGSALTVVILDYLNVSGTTVSGSAGTVSLTSLPLVSAASGGAMFGKILLAGVPGTQITGPFDWTSGTLYRNGRFVLGNNQGFPDTITFTPSTGTIVSYRYRVWGRRS